MGATLALVKRETSVPIAELMAVGPQLLALDLPHRRAKVAEEESGKESEFGVAALIFLGQTREGKSTANLTPVCLGIKTGISLCLKRAPKRIRETKRLMRSMAK